MKTEEVYLSILKNLDGNKKVKIGAELYEMVKKIVETGIRTQYPNISEIELKEKMQQRFNYEPRRSR